MERWGYIYNTEPSWLETSLVVCIDISELIPIVRLASWSAPASYHDNILSYNLTPGKYIRSELSQFRVTVSKLRQNCIVMAVQWLMSHRPRQMFETAIAEHVWSASSLIYHQKSLYSSYNFPRRATLSSTGLWIRDKLKTSFHLTWWLI